MTTKESCAICCENYNKSSHLKIGCYYCEFLACRSCCETYILSCTEPTCMNIDCKSIWSHKFIRENFTNTFINTKFKEHKELILFDQEKALLPATQIVVEEIIRKEKVLKEIDEFNREIDELKLKIYKKQLEHKIRSDTSVKQYIRQCPAKECRGFLSSHWKCGLCEQVTCSQCNEIKEAIHTCDPNSVETEKLLSKDSKPCPKCQSLIFKISGCDQIWCTQCHTAFSWKTGNIETVIHNPHYYEWQRNHGGLDRTPGDIECGLELHNQTMHNIYYIIRQRHSKLYTYKTDENWIGSVKKIIYNWRITKLEKIVMNTIHNNVIELRKYQPDYFVQNQYLRIQYLRKYINEEHFKTMIQRNDKKHRINIELCQIIQFANITITDIVNRIKDDLNNYDMNKYTLDVFMNEFNEVNSFCNESFKNIALTYGTTPYEFDDLFHMQKIKSGEKADEKAV